MQARREQRGEECERKVEGGRERETGKEREREREMQRHPIHTYLSGRRVHAKTCLQLYVFHVITFVLWSSLTTLAASASLQGQLQSPSFTSSFALVDVA
jgi:hypothetical protein